MTAALTAEGLHTYYGKSHILHGVGLEVAEGKITALLGRICPRSGSPPWVWVMFPRGVVSSPISALKRT